MYETILELTTLLGRIDRLCDRRARFAGFPGPEQRALAEIAKSPLITDGEIGHRLGMASGQVSKAVTGLISRKLVQSIPAPWNKNQRQLSVTPEGGNFAETIRKARREAFKREYENLSPAEQRLITDADFHAEAPRHIPAQKVEIRPLSREGITTLLGVVTAKIRKERGWTAGLALEMARMLVDHFDHSEKGHGGGWFAIRGGKYVGVCLLMPGRGVHPVRYDSGGATIHLMHVNEADRRQGHGTVLVKEALKLAEQVGYSTVQAPMPLSITSLRGFFRKHKFKQLESPRIKVGFDEIENWIDLTRKIG